MQIVEVRRDGDGVAARMSRMRDWFYEQKIEPRLFRLDARCFRLEFEADADAIAFAAAFDGQIIQAEPEHMPRPGPRNILTRRAT